MKSLSAEAELARRLKGLAGGKARPRDLASRFAARLSEVAARPDAVPIRLCGGKIEARAGGTLLAAAMKSGIRMMHACGAQTLCATCRVKVTEERGEPHPDELQGNSRCATAVDEPTGAARVPRARVLGPVDAEVVFPLCGALPGDH